LAVPAASFGFDLWGGGAADGDSRFAAIDMDGDKRVTSRFSATDVTQGDVVDALFIRCYDVDELAAANQCLLRQQPTECRGL
jgi:hypothetical protein